MVNNCEHRRIKRNYPFGRNSKPLRVCKDCGILMNTQIMKEKRKKAEQGNKFKKRRNNGK